MLEVIHNCSIWSTFLSYFLNFYVYLVCEVEIMHFQDNLNLAELQEKVKKLERKLVNDTFQFSSLIVYKQLLDSVLQFIYSSCLMLDEN